eukprot:GFUD01027283.1.p1 GENE.GFUD01027283.1~~GFUD01027283.1.p1  ORF type:complete len:399 (+),score=129.40 GFUD01027283.1:141-1337(+)
MLGYSYMVRSLRTGKDTTADDTETSESDSGFWVVWGKLKRRSKRQLWRDRLARLELKDLQRVATLGVGGFGRVDLVTIDSREDKKSFALKTIPKSVLRDAEHRRHSIAEKEIHSILDSKFIIQLYRTFQDKEHLHMLMEICLGGELWTLLRDHNYFPDLTARFYIGCVVEALDYLHSLGIIYRDIKPENCLISHTGYLKLVDMGLAKKMKTSAKTFSFCGTAEYVPPEVVLKTGHGRQTDLWALGILIYELVEGRPPFLGENPVQTYQLILRGVDCAHFPDYVSSAAEDIVRSLCRKKPQDRLGAGVGGFNLVRRHKWFKDFIWKDLRSQTLPAPIIPCISSHVDTSCFDSFSTSIPSTSSSGYSSEEVESVESEERNEDGVKKDASIFGWLGLLRCQ